MRTGDRFPVRKGGGSRIPPPKAQPGGEYYLVMAAVILMLMVAFSVLGIVASEKQAASTCATSADCQEHIQIYEGLTPKDLPR